MDDPVPPADWLARLRAALVADAPTATDGEIDALLDLARVAAHTSERWTAPVSTFVAGLALADLPPAEREQRIREATARLAGSASQ